MATTWCQRPSYLAWTTAAAPSPAPGFCPATVHSPPSSQKILSRLQGPMMSNKVPSPRATSEPLPAPPCPPSSTPSQGSSGPFSASTILPGPHHLPYHHMSPLSHQLCLLLRCFLQEALPDLRKPPPATLRPGTHSTDVLAQTSLCTDLPDRVCVCRLSSHRT